MKICVVTPYFQTKLAWLQQAHESVRAQTIPATHILICDGCALADIPSFSGIHIRLARNYQDYGNTPRLIGCYSAVADGADAIAFLDADNWYQPDHLVALLHFAQANNLDACSSGRSLHRLDGSFLARCTTVNARPQIDASCLLVMRSAFRYLVAWGLCGQEIAAIGDQMVWQSMQEAGARLGFLDRPSLCYRTRHAAHYRAAGEEPPPDAIEQNDWHGERYR